MKRKKKETRGRPKGPEKEAVNMYLRSSIIKNVRQMSIAEKRTNSAIIETALEKTYGFK